MNNQDLVLFDVGAVLLELNYNGLFDAGAKFTGKSREEFKKIYNDSNLEPRVLSGEISHESFLQGFKGLLNNNSLTENQLAKIFRNAWGNQVKETINLKKKLVENNYSVGIFSNINQFAINILSKEFPDMFESFGGPKIYSYQAGATKEKNTMFEIVKKLGFENITYIDDNEVYVKKGLEYGWNGILFTPYVDNSEAIRSVKGHNVSHEGKKFKTANNISELEQALNDFNIKIK